MNRGFISKESPTAIQVCIGSVRAAYAPLGIELEDYRTQWADAKAVIEQRDELVRVLTQLLLFVPLNATDTNKHNNNPHLMSGCIVCAISEAEAALEKVRSNSK